jgi:cell division protein FtsQ
MDRRGRELFEVGHSRMTRLQAQDAILHPPAHDPSSSEDEADNASPRGPYQIEPDMGVRPSGRRTSFLSWKPKRGRLLIAALGIGLGLGAVEEAMRVTGHGPKLERLARVLGFGIDQVTLTGHHFSFDRDIFDALDLANVRTFAALDTAAVKSRIERLPWVDTAELTRVYPGALEIRVTERKPYALWQRTDRHYLIDKTGRVLAAVSGDSLPDLPRFAGEGAAAEAAGLMENLARYPEVASRLSEAERVSERRWTLKLQNATTIELPADGEVGALEELSRDTALVRLVAAGGTTLDFRGPGRVAVRPATPDPTSATAASNTGS